MIAAAGVVPRLFSKPASGAAPMVSTQATISIRPDTRSVSRSGDVL
ncbi:MAG: hypothetical protein ABII82_16110 [Verrucomicrobiota bacterium]